MAEIYSAPSLNTVSRDKKSASVRQVDVPTDFSPIDPDKKVWSSATKNRLVFGGLKGPVLAIMLRAPLFLFWFSQERGVYC